jgi:NADPH-dependent ferric siderophore reductase
MKIADAVLDRAARLLFRDLRLTKADQVAPGFHLLELQGDPLLGVTTVVGSKVQVRIEGMTNRTYTPIGLSAHEASLRLLACVHGDGPGSRWVEAASVGDEVQVFGPRGSLDLSALDDPPLLVGDETSFGLAAAWVAAYPDQPPSAQCYEVDDVGAATAALAAVGVVGDAVHLVPRSEGRTTFAEHVGELVEGQVGRTLVLTGCAQTIREVRGHLKGRDLKPTSKVKAYWDEKRSGLD